MKQILLPFGSDSVEEAPVDAALELAGRHGGHVEAMFYPRLPDPVVVDPMSGGVVSYDGLDEESEAQRHHAERRMAERATACRAQHGAKLDEQRFTINLSELSNWRQVGEVSRVHDVALIARAPDNPHWQTLFEMALFEGGRPVILTPEGWDKPYGDTIAIAWNRAVESARTVALALPLLAKAKRVIVMTVEGWVHSGPECVDLQRYLATHEIESEICTAPEGGNPGAKCLQMAEREGVDLMVKGAYTQSRLTQMIFGGATRTMLDTAPIPVLLAH